MTEKKARSAFVPIMLLIVVALVLVIALVPMVECEGCFGLITLTSDEWDQYSPFEVSDDYDGIEYIVSCEWCALTGRTTLWRKVSDDPLPNFNYQYPLILTEEDVLKIFESHQSNP